jgi:hypothetical protein
VTINERDALIEILNVLIRVSFRNCGDAEKIELLAQWRESYEVLCAKTCSMEIN